MAPEKSFKYIWLAGAKINELNDFAVIGIPAPFTWQITQGTSLPIWQAIQDIVAWLWIAFC